MKAFSKNLKLLVSILIAVAILSPSNQTSAWADVVAKPGYLVTLLNDELAGPVELDFDPTGNIFVANEGAPGVFAFEDFVSKLAPTGVTIVRKFIDNLEGASGLKVDTNGNIYVSQDVGRTINKYDSTGTFVLSFEPHRPNFSDPNTLALTQDGRILAAVANVPSDNQWRVLAYDIQTGQRLQDFTAPFEFGFVNAVVYRNGRVFIGGAVGSTTRGPILIAEEGQTPVAYAYNDRLPPGYGVNGLVVNADGTLFVTDTTQLSKISTDGSVTLLATGFQFARGLAEKDGCILVADFRDGITGALYRVCPESKPVCTSVAANAHPNTLWPPNHNMVPVTITISVPDSCNAPLICKVIEVGSNEPVNGLGDGNTFPDWEIIDDLVVNLRAERSGNGTGRVYTLIGQCVDAVGNSASWNTTITVPHNR